MALALKPPYPPMEALSVDEIPAGKEWQYEPKWDGFRCLAFRDGDWIYLQSKSGQSLARYFPELVLNLKALKAKRFVLDGEIAIAPGGAFSFDALLQRIHPAASRIEKLAAETPATLIVFDLLAGADGRALVALPLAERRRRLEAFARENFSQDSLDTLDALDTLDPTIRLSPATTDAATARRWLKLAGGALDGIVAKRLDLDYRSGERAGMLKIKRKRTADCVVGGFRYASKGRAVGSLLLGLYNEDGRLDHVGFSSGFSDADRKKLLKKLEPLIEPPGFTGSAPGGPSRWSTKRSMEWQPLRPKLVAEVEYDHFTGRRFRHGTKFLRWRPDKAARRCTMDQVAARRKPRENKLLRTGSD